MLTSSRELEEDLFLGGFPALASSGGFEGVEFDSSSQSGTHSAQEETKLISVCNYSKRSKPFERAGGFFLCENGGSENSACGKQAVESILKASPLPPHPFPFHSVGSVGMFFIRRGLFTRLQPLHECVSERACETEREREVKLRKAFIYRYLKAVGL